MLFLTEDCCTLLAAVCGFVKLTPNLRRLCTWCTKCYMYLTALGSAGTRRRLTVHLPSDSSCAAAGCFILPCHSENLSFLHRLPCLTENERNARAAGVKASDADRQVIIVGRMQAADVKGPPTHVLAKLITASLHIKPAIIGDMPVPEHQCMLTKVSPHRLCGAHRDGKSPRNSTVTR